MSEFVRPSYLEALPPTQRLPDNVPTTPTSPPATTSLSASAAATETSPPASTPPPASGTVKYSGRIVSPVHRVERAGGPAVSFTLEETDAAGQSTLHRVYATKQFAERLTRQQLAQGMLVEVAGQEQLRNERQPDGDRRAVPYLYCFGVRVLATAVEQA